MKMNLRINAGIGAGRTTCESWARGNSRSGHRDMYMDLAPWEMPEFLYDCMGMSLAWSDDTFMSNSSPLEAAMAKGWSLSRKWSSSAEMNANDDRDSEHLAADSEVLEDDDTTKGGNVRGVLDEILSFFDIDADPNPDAPSA